MELHKNARLRIDDIVWAVERRVSTGIQLVGIGDGALRIMSDQDFLSGFRAGKIEQLSPLVDPNTARACNPYNRDFLSIPEKSRSEGERRAMYIDTLLKEAGPPPYSDQRLEELIPLLHSVIGDRRPAPGRSTFRRWLAKQSLLGFHSKADLLIQIDDPNRHQGNRTDRFPARVESLMIETIETDIICHAPRPISIAYANLVEKIRKENLTQPDDPLPTPPSRTFYRRVGKYDDDIRIERQRSRKAAKDKYASVQVAPKEHVPLAIVEIDHNYVDCEVVDDDGLVLGRPTLTAAIDRATRMCVGYVLTWEPPSATCVMLLLRHMILDKAYVKEAFGDNIRHDWPCYGVPSSIVVDNGADFHSNHFKNACDGLGRIQLIYAEPGQPQMRGLIERFFGTLNTGLFHLLPGTTLSRIDRSSDYDPSKAARVPLRKLNQYLHKYIIDIYSRRGHRGLKAIPVDAWNAGVEKYPPRMPNSIRDLNILSCAKTERTLSRRGIELFSTFFRAPEFAAVRLKAKGDLKVEIYYDPTDISHIWVQAPCEPNFIEAKCIAENYSQRRTIWQHKKVLDHLGPEARFANENDLLRAVVELCQMIDEGKKKPANRHKTKRVAARFLEQPQTPAELATLAVELPDYATNEAAFTTEATLATMPETFPLPLKSRASPKRIAPSPHPQKKKSPGDKGKTEVSLPLVEIIQRLEPSAAPQKPIPNDTDLLDVYIKQNPMTARKLR
jgi:putative transposase